MDKIYVSETALNSALDILRDLQEETNVAFVNLEQVVSGNVSELEYNFKAVVDDLIGVLGDFNSKLSSCIEDNMSAVAERKNKLKDYETYSYKKINMY